MLAIAYYGSFTFITQVETWFFLSDITVSNELLLGLFIMGLPVPILFIPLTIWICGRWKPSTTIENKYLVLSLKQFLLKLGMIAVLYVIIYWLAGYFIAWQNPELRTFYGSPGQIVPFWEHTFTSLIDSPGLFLMQIARGILFALITIPVIRGSMVNPWITALLVGLLLAIPHLGHIMSNPIIPVASVRFSHMIETTTSTFLFGLAIVWLLHRSHENWRDLIGIRSTKSHAS